MGEQFNPEMLLLARQYRGQSQSDVAKLARINQGYYSRIENGLLPGEPAGDTVDRLSVALRFPRGFFYQYDRVYGLPISIHPMHRKRADVGERALQQLHAELNVRLAHLRRLLKATEFTQERPLPKIDVDDGGGPEKVAATVRLAWGLPPGPVANLTECAERSGVLVVWCRFSANVDGVPCIFRPPAVHLFERVSPRRQDAVLPCPRNRASGDAQSANGRYGKRGSCLCAGTPHSGA